jgi:hypothetical protein
MSPKSGTFQIVALIERMARENTSSCLRTGNCGGSCSGKVEASRPHARWGLTAAGLLVHNPVYPALPGSSIVNRPGFDRDSSVVSGDQTGQVAQLPQSLELGRWPAPAGSVKSPIVVPVHPCCGGDVDFFDIVPRPAGLYQLGLVQADR